MQRFQVTSDYVATDDLKVAVNAAVLLRRPLLGSNNRADRKGAWI